MKLRKHVLALLIPLVLLCSCATTAYKYSEDVSASQLSDAEGVVVFRIHNPYVGKSVHLFDVGTSRPLSAEPIVLNSDLKMQRNGSSPFLVPNRNSEVQLVCFPLKKGTYYVTDAGDYSIYKKPYSFTVEPGSVNYAGDFYLQLYMNTRTSAFGGVIDWYSLTVTDEMDEAMEALRERYPSVSALPVVNHSRAQSELIPFGCSGERISEDDLK